MHLLGKEWQADEFISLLCRIYVARLYISDLTFTSLHVSNVHDFHKPFGYDGRSIPGGFVKGAGGLFHKPIYAYIFKSTLTKLFQY